MPLIDPMSPLFPLQAATWLWVVWVFYWVVSSQFVLKQKKREGLARIQHTIPTLIGVVCVFHVLSEKAWLGYFCEALPLRWLGVAIVLAGHCFSMWARVHLGKYWSGTVALKEGHRLITTGPYGLVRHPIYTGLLSAVFGTALAAGTWEALLGFCVMVPAYIVKWRREERVMTGEFGQEYLDYMKKTKAIVPFIF